MRSASGTEGQVISSSKRMVFRMCWGMPSKGQSSGSQGPGGAVRREGEAVHGLHHPIRPSGGQPGQ